MYKFLIFITFTGFLFCGVDSFKISEKEYENIDRVLEFGVQVFLNCLDKLKEATEKMVKDDMLRTNRIAIQDSWNSFKETTNRISNEERGKGVEDDLIVAARIIRRVVLHYKDDVQTMFHAIAIEQNVQLYLPVVNTFKGSFNKAKAKEIWSTLVTHYFPDAPPIESDPWEFLCYLLSTNAVETFIVNVLKVGVDLSAEYKKIDFEEMTQRVSEMLEKIFDKLRELYQIEQEKENDGFIIITSTISRAFLFYWDTFLNTTDIPTLKAKYENIESNQKYRELLETIDELLRPIMDSETVKDVLRLHYDFAREFYEAASTAVFFLSFSGSERLYKTFEIVAMEIFIESFFIYEKLSEMGVVSEMKRLYLRAMDLAVALSGTEEIQYFRETYFEKWKSFREELNTLVEEERQNPHVILPQVRATGRMLLQKFLAFLDRVNAEIDDDTLRDLAVNLVNLRKKCIAKLLARGVVTQDQVDEAQRIFENDVLGFYQKYEVLSQGLDPKRAEEILRALLKVLMVGFNFIYAPLTQAWNFVAN